MRKDLCILTDPNQVREFVVAMMMAVRARSTDTICDRILPNAHPTVRAFMAQQEKAAIASVQTQVNKGGQPKWVAQHQKFAAEHRLSRRSMSSTSVAGLRCPRVRDGWDLLTSAHPGLNLVADMSQMLPRAPFSPDGICPTITPNGIYAMKRLGRIMMPEEKLLAHGFPLHKMNVPENLRKELGVFGGNTMHLASIGLALLIGIGLVDWSRPGVGPGKKLVCSMPDMAPAIFIAGQAATKRVTKRPASAHVRKRRCMGLTRRGVAGSADSVSASAPRQP